MKGCCRTRLLLLLLCGSFLQFVICVVLQVLESFQCTSFVRCVKQNPESPACFRFRRLFQETSSVRLGLQRLCHRCLLYVSDFWDFFTAVCCMFCILETFILNHCLLYVLDFWDFFTTVCCVFQIPDNFLFNHCLLYVSDSRDFFFTTVFCMFQILESSQTLLNVLKRESQSLKEKSYPTTTGGSTQRTMTQS